MKITLIATMFLISTLAWSASVDLMLTSVKSMARKTNLAGSKIYRQAEMPSHIVQAFAKQEILLAMKVTDGVYAVLSKKAQGVVLSIHVPSMVGRKASRSNETTIFYSVRPYVEAVNKALEDQGLNPLMSPLSQTIKLPGYSSSWKLINGGSSYQLSQEFSNGLLKEMDLFFFEDLMENVAHAQFRFR